jgi:ABC-type transporter Mla subunit MlaD
MAGKASPEAMERMVQNLTKCIESQQSVIAALRRDYELIKEEWDDKQYAALGNVVNEAIQSLSTNYNPLSECITKVQLLKSKLNEYLATQI